MVLLQPRVNALPVKLVGARDDPQFLKRWREEEEGEQAEPCPKTWTESEGSLDGREPCGMEINLMRNSLQPSFAWSGLCSSLILLAVSSSRE